MSSIAKRIKGLTRPKTSNQAASVAVSDSPKRSGSPVDRGAPAALPRAPAAVSVLPLPKPKGAEGGANAQMRPAVRSSFARLRHFLVALSFLLFVVAPSAVSGVYLWTVAVDQYASSVGFAVRREDAGSPTDVLSGLTNFSGSSSTDTDILFEYLQSQKLVSEMDAEIDLRGRWSKPEEDPVFALEKDAPIEALMDYWMRMVRVSYGTGAGLIEIEVRAFEGEDATLIAQTIFGSGQLIPRVANAVGAGHRTQIVNHLCTLGTPHGHPMTVRCQKPGAKAAIWLPIWNPPPHKARFIPNGSRYRSSSLCSCFCCGALWCWSTTPLKIAGNTLSGKTSDDRF